ncbi:hypothetical protein [Nissabacter sp. SGAir0207]|uniref:hypothetical protein n=1 Tax=Nissabacter sp. SGAir0207 TaxID=2126321 RepID=UPI0010CD5262|nr:hypothetical protein [Nissabacter sp. SGAir0207]QCR38907.1 hypothetical protein C1N62_22620 [Nissabacter sp. SGAir0207]
MKTYHLTSLFDRLCHQLHQPGLAPEQGEALYRKILRWQEIRACYQEDVGTDRLNPQARLMKYLLIARSCENRLEWCRLDDAVIEALVEINENTYYVVRFHWGSGGVTACRYCFNGTGFVCGKRIEGLATVLRRVKWEVRPC